MAMEVMSQVEHGVFRAAAAGLGENKLIRVNCEEFLQQAAVKNGLVWDLCAIPNK